MTVTKFPHLKIWLFCKRRLFQIFGQFRELFKETNGKERERKNKNALEDTKKRNQKDSSFLISKSLIMNR